MGGELFILIILIMLSAFFSGAEVALVSTSMIRVKRLLDENRMGAGSLNRLKKNPKRMIITILIGNNIVNISAASMATVMATEIFGSGSLGIVTGLLTLVILIFGEITPKTFATTHASRISLLVALPIEILSFTLYPLVKILERFSDFINRLVKVKSIEQISEAEVKSMIQLGVDHQILEPEEKIIMERAMRFSDITVSDVMTPIDEMFSVDASRTIVESLPMILGSGFSRIPVFKGSKNNISGVVFVKDILKQMNDKKQHRKLDEIAVEPLLTAGRTGIDDVFKLFQERQTHIAFITDSHQKIIGAATLEDLLEELVGEITDESEIIPNRIMRINKGTIVTHGNTLVSKVNAFFNTKLPVDSKNQTLHNFFGRQGGIFRKGSSVLVKGVSLTLDNVRGDNFVIKLTKEKLAVSYLNDLLKKLVPKLVQKSKL